MSTTPISSYAGLTRPELSVVVDDYRILQNASQFLWRKFYPTVPTNRTNGRFYHQDTRDKLRRYPVRRAPNGPFARINFTFDQRGFQVIMTGLEQAFDKEELIDLTGTPFGNLGFCARDLQYIYELQYEIDVAESLRNNDAWSDNPTSVIPFLTTKIWDDSFDAVRWFAIARLEAKKRIGIAPNVLVISESVHNFLKINPSIKDAVASQGAGESVVSISDTLLARVLGFRNVWVGTGQFNVATQGQTIDTAIQPIPNRPIVADMEDIWSDDEMYMGFIAPGEGWTAISYGKNVAFYPKNMGNVFKPVFETYEEPTTSTVVLRLKQKQELRVTSQQLWTRYTGCWGTGPIL